MAQRVFISHSSQDKAIANTVCQFLEKQGLACWTAPRNVPAGSKYGAVIVNALEDALAVIFIFSEHSNTSEQVMNEIERAVSKKKPIFPLKISPITPSAELEFFISRSHWLDLTTLPLDTALPQLAEALHALAGAEASTEAPTVRRGAGTGQKPGQLFVLEAAREGERLKLSAYERVAEDERPLRHYEYWEVSFAAVDRAVDRLVTLLNRATHSHGTLDPATWQEVKTQGEILYHQLLAPSIRERLKGSTATNLLLHLDDALVQLPWELLFDGDAFLCCRFSIGRFVSTQQAVVEWGRGHQHRALTMRIIADPQGNLAAAAREGDTLRRELAAEGRRLQVDLCRTPVDTAIVKAALAQCDVLHYAGHADYDPSEPAQSGWLLADGKLTAAETLQMGKEAPMPALVFCNACHSGQTPAWKVTQEAEQNIYGLANAFLRAGVQHYLGSFWEIPDEPSSTLAIEFYRALARGATIGVALSTARQRLMEQYGEASVVWASYVLYGDPTSRYLDTTPDRRKLFLPLGAAVLVVVLAILALFVIDGRWSGTPPEVPSLVQSYQTLAHGELTETARAVLIDRLVAEVLRAHKAGRKPEKRGDGWTSTPLILAFLRGSFKPALGEDEALLNGVEQALRETGRFTIIERGLLDKLLAELKLSATELIDRQTALRVGRILGAGMLAAGGISHRGDEGLLTVRLFDTETSEILASGDASFKTPSTSDRVGQPLAQDLLQKLRRDRRKRYLLRGQILRVTPTIILNIGAEQGITRDLLMEVIEPIQINGKTEYFSRDDVGRLKVTSVSVRTSQAELLNPGVTLQPGWKVQEVQEQ